MFGNSDAVLGTSPPAVGHSAAALVLLRAATMLSESSLHLVLAAAL